MQDTTEEPVKRAQFEYTNDAGTVRITREAVNFGDVARVIEIEEVRGLGEDWRRVHRNTRNYGLGDDAETLKGDGSNWRGTGRNWEEWFEQRHTELLRRRFPWDEGVDSDGR